MVLASDPPAMQLADPRKLDVGSPIMPQISESCVPAGSAPAIAREHVVEVGVVVQHKLVLQTFDGVPPQTVVATAALGL